jgi:hypothetical protein
LNAPPFWNGQLELSNNRVRQKVEKKSKSMMLRMEWFFYLQFLYLLTGTWSMWDMMSHTSAILQILMTR